jgi:hypothetical protein
MDGERWTKLSRPGRKGGTEMYGYWPVKDKDSERDTEPMIPIEVIDLYYCDGCGHHSTAVCREHPDKCKQSELAKRKGSR